MSFTPPSRTGSGPRRRSLLTSAAGAAVLAGCSAPESPSSGTAARSPSAADAARARAARDSETLAARYAAVIAAHPPLAKRLDPLRNEVVRHARAFGGTGSRPSASPSASASASPSDSASASPSDSASAASSGSLSAVSSASGSASASPAVPAREKDALADLAAAELALVDRRTRALLDVPGELARLLASVAAAGAAHAYVLTEEKK
ncbi:hypothetical protein OHB41_32660 [Streptomyces sp. NBC_01571]|uniref:hypothetical protein n=1 Tax=Streptomyces sp. NBC_01571 TaxID=2975883 RepID=UPI002252C386|nr:hypothetical protein [Streptomyces sp. NBC_01571]MCX4577856.1 hypothetical protein [Streptomyces sp. NBC_01571]